MLNAIARQLPNINRQKFMYMICDFLETNLDVIDDFVANLRNDQKSKKQLVDDIKSDGPIILCMHDHLLPIIAKVLDRPVIVLRDHARPLVTPATDDLLITTESLVIIKNDQDGNYTAAIPIGELSIRKGEFSQRMYHYNYLDGKYFIFFFMLLTLGLCMCHDFMVVPFTFDQQF